MEPIKRDEYLEAINLILNPGEYGLGDEPGSYNQASTKVLFERLLQLHEQLVTELHEADRVRIRKILQEHGHDGTLINIYMDDLVDAEPADYPRMTDAEIYHEAAGYIDYIQRGLAR